MDPQKKELENARKAIKKRMPETAILVIESKKDLFISKSDQLEAAILQYLANFCLAARNQDKGIRIELIKKAKNYFNSAIQMLDNASKIEVLNKIPITLQELSNSAYQEQSDAFLLEALRISSIGLGSFSKEQSVWDTRRILRDWAGQLKTIPNVENETTPINS